MSKKLTRRKRHFLVLCLLLLGTMFGAFGGLNTYTKSTSAQELGGNLACIAPEGCLSWGCNYKKECVLSGTDCAKTACQTPPSGEN